MLDHEAEVRAQIADAISALTLDPDTYGYAVNWQVIQQGNQQGIGWQLLITVRSPLLGQPPIAAIGAILTSGVPQKPDVRDAVAKAIAELQATTAKLLKTANGHAPLPGKVS